MRSSRIFDRLRAAVRHKVSAGEAPAQEATQGAALAEIDRLKAELDSADELLLAWGEYDGRVRASLALALGVESPDVPLFEELLGEVRKLASSSSRANVRILSALTSLLEHFGVELRSQLELSPELALPHAQVLIEQELARRVALAVEAERERVRFRWAEALGRDGEPASEDELARFTRELASEAF